MFMVGDIPKDVEIQRQLTSIRIKDWLHEDVFRLQWWILIIFLLLLITVWWIAVDKSRLPEISLFAGLAIIVCMGINEYGQEMVLWDFPKDIIPIFPPLSSVNLICLPVGFSIVYQRFRGWKSYISAILTVTFFICFIIEPILSVIGLYHLVRWQFYYSYPIYILVAISVRYFTNTIISINKKFERFL
jgi:hypothetical protein